MDATALRWVLAIVGIVVIAGVYLFAQYQNRLRRQGAVKTFTQDELENEQIEDERLRDGLSSISTMLDQDDLKQELGDIKINPAMDAQIKDKTRARTAIELPRIMQQIDDSNLVAHVLKHTEERVLTGMEIADAFRHLGLQVNDDGLAHAQDTNAGDFQVASMSENGSLGELNDPQFYTYGLVCFFDLSVCDDPRNGYELMLKKVDELVRMLDLKVYDQNLQLLTLQHVTETREKLKAAASA